jgi:hypothetical protein
LPPVFWLLGGAVAGFGPFAGSVPMLIAFVMLLRWAFYRLMVAGVLRFLAHRQRDTPGDPLLPVLCSAWIRGADFAVAQQKEEYRWSREAVLPLPLSSAAVAAVTAGTLRAAYVAVDSGVE